MTHRKALLLYKGSFDGHFDAKGDDKMAHSLRLIPVLLSKFVGNHASKNSYDPVQLRENH